MKINYDLKMEEILKEIRESGERKRLLIHSCCGPCSSSVLEYLKDYFKIDIYFYNPNITFDYEYYARIVEQKEMLEKLLNRIETIIEDNQPVSKGTFAKFANIFKKYPEIVNTVGAILLKWLSSKN